MYQYKVMVKDRIPYLKKASDKEYSNEEINEVKDAFKLIEEIFEIRYAAEEHLVMIALDSEFRPLGAFEVSHGTTRESIASTREIFKMALLCGAECIILAHNHPTGDPAMSKEDEKVLKQVEKGGKLLDIQLIEFMVIGNDIYSSSEGGIIKL